MKSKRREIPSEIPTPQNSGNPNKFEIHKIQETHKFSGNIEVRWSKILSDSEALKKWQYLINTVGEEATRIFVKNAEEDFVFISSSQICSQSWFVYRDDRLEDFAKNEVSLWQVGEHLKYQCQTILKTSPSKSVRNLVNNADFNCNYQNSKLESNATKALNML